MAVRRRHCRWPDHPVSDPPLPDHASLAIIGYVLLLAWTSMGF
jgi:hypothetical protein